MHFLFRKGTTDEGVNKGNNKITELRTIFQRESQNPLVLRDRICTATLFLA